MQNDASAHIDDLIDFVVDSPNSYHAAHTIAARLDAAGFARIDERQAFPGQAGKYYLVRDGAVAAWLQPESLAPDASFRIVGTHTDSPALKVKPGDLPTSAGYAQVGVEIYGGMLLNSWLDRELGVAGRIATRDGKMHLVRTGAIARVPQLAVHLDRASTTP